MFKIVTDPNSILHKRTKAVTKFDSKLLKLIEEMKETMRFSDGIGLAAPQIGNSTALCVIEIPLESKRYKHIKNTSRIPFTVLINPKIIWASKNRKPELEGCLSLPGIGVNVNRPIEITVKAQDELGNQREIKAVQLFARVIQHELDHLNGILITDHGKAEPFEY